MLCEKKFSCSAVRYGMKMENATRGALEYDMKVRVQKVGIIILYPQPWLCCSLDGIFTKHGKTVLVEIKCPFSRKEQKIVDFDQKKSFVPYIIFDESANLQLKRIMLITRRFSYHFTAQV